MSQRPWDFHSDLSRDRLQLIAEILRHVRRDAVRRHDPAIFETSWTLGCSIYGRSAEMLARVGGELWDWFRVIQPPLEFVFSVGQVPMRFCRDDPDHPEGQHLRVTEAEYRQYEFVFGSHSVDLIWRIVVAANPAGETDSVVVIGASPSGDVHCKYVIPELDGGIAFLTGPLSPRTGAGVELPAPVVKPRLLKSQKRSDDEGI